MRAPLFISFGTKDYEVVVGTAQARGTFYIRRVQDDTTTYRFVCSEGLRGVPSAQARLAGQPVGVPPTLPHV